MRIRRHVLVHRRTEGKSFYEQTEHEASERARGGVERRCCSARVIQGAARKMKKIEGKRVISVIFENVWAPK
jgi:hypothetical protein